MFKSASEKRARSYAERHGFSLRRIPHSINHPNGYIRITAPNGVQMRARDMVDAMDEMMSYRMKMKK